MLKYPGRSARGLSSNCEHLNIVVVLPPLHAMECGADDITMTSPPNAMDIIAMGEMERKGKESLMIINPYKMEDSWPSVHDQCKR